MLAPDPVRVSLDQEQRAPLEAVATRDREARFDFGPEGMVRFPVVALSFDDQGTGLDLNVVQNFASEGGTQYQRSLGTRWSLRDDDLIETACRLAGRDVTEDDWAKYIGDSVPNEGSCSTT